MIASKGVTTVSDMGVGGNFGVDKEVAILQEIYGKKQAPIRFRGYLFGVQLPAGYADKPDAIKPGEGDDHFRLVGIKYVADGSTQGLTGALNEPYIYADAHGSTGALNFKDDEIYNLIKPYYDKGWQIAMHSNGDRAIDQTLKNYEKLLSCTDANSKDRRLRIEHFTVSNPAQVKKAVELGVIPGFTIGHVEYWGSAFNNQFLGPDRAQRLDPAGDFKRAGGRFCLHSDSPVSSVCPLAYISQEVTRVWQLPPPEVLGPDQAVSVDDAIRAVTIDAAYSMFADHLVGSLEVGKQADFVLLEKNPRTTSPAEIRNIKVLGTWIDGKPVKL
jgi:predicted amidohydrolase YtcJ